MTDEATAVRSDIARGFALCACGAWVLACLGGAIADAVFGIYQAPFAVAAFALPTILLIDAILTWLDPGTLGDTTETIVFYIAVLLSGFIQYGGVAYVLGRLVQLLRMERGRSA